MIWAISIFAFLGTLFAVLSVMFVWSRRAEISATLKEHRGENRIPAGVHLELSKLNESVAEKVATENVSRHGARVLVKTHWQPNERVLVRLPQELERSPARITYCRPLSEQSFAVGLQFSSGFEEQSFGIQPPVRPIYVGTLGAKSK